MADIQIQRTHSMPLKKARDAANDFAQRLNEKFDLESEWEGDTLHFKRSGRQSGGSSQGRAREKEEGLNCAALGRSRTGAAPSSAWG